VLRRTFLSASTSVLALRSIVEGKQAASASAVRGAAGTLRKDSQRLSKNFIRELRESLEGELVSPDDSNYEAARKVWNARVDARPALIAFCQNSIDVVKCVRSARDHGMKISIRGGGHGTNGASVQTASLTIDLSRMRRVNIDASVMLGRTEAGTLVRDFDQQSQSLRLATPTSMASGVSMGGLVMAGGIGRLARQYGLTIDNLLSAEIVTADGSLTTASPSLNPDLYWGIRGGAGNYGIAVNLEFLLHDHPRHLICARLTFQLVDASKVFEAVSILGQYLSDKQSLSLTIAAAADGSKYLELWGDFQSVVSANKVLNPIRKVIKPLQDSVAILSYLDVQKSDDVALRPGQIAFAKSAFLTRLSPLFVETLLTICQEFKWSTMLKIAVLHVGGAMSRIRTDETAFPFRDSNYLITIVALTENPAIGKAIEGWLQSAWDRLFPHCVGEYVGFVDRVSGQTEGGILFSTNYRRLVELKRTWDPDNTFQGSVNIGPAQPG
jgi:hypothetical protein